MKKISFVILTLVFNSMLSAQNDDFGKFPSENNVEKPMLTSDLLKSLNWKKLKEFSNSNQGHYAYERKDSLLTEYEYVQQGRVANFELTSFNGKVLEYHSQISNTSKETNTNYFDKEVWLEYAHKYLPNLPDSLKLTVAESKDVLKAYYELIGVGTRDEYGWICEYSTVGMATQRRQATMQLIRYQRRDLLEQVVNYPNVQVQLYITDALIYDDLQKKEYIEENLKAELTQMTEELDSLKSKKITDWRIESLNYRISDSNEYIEQLESELLSDNDWKRIYALRDSNQQVKTCKSGTGSYKTYENTTDELLSESAILEIPKRYSELESLGYFR
ncbi:hypothetical protein ESY86_20555 [Subsaximicrobium wynnwilliamsii]|uniref:Uncharacterized protein n=2 Tax=Subsaximicrobium wynnwilliamsii TaxID=291179 RepID=A0A5C6ZB28_9FLAO|nr:hypothetical protein [Subsaximicrobium wynnwilliamsii]TXD80899.1 hypothetical protein ESY87_19865 [Subsaximicrobium wynnwilliamsii]TXD86170.1 hypothetical protein ESY86_20555 [Subsaximicrobium wynnwilliamsii]TXE00275.1 hypothetical protein ESY88_19720 [Subsaximicrobium wynnwilliamsii]